MTEKDCPDSTVLVDFLQGKLVPPELENCESHLKNCNACQETLGGLNASDTLSEVVAKAIDPQKPTTDDAEVVKRLVQRLGDPTDLTISRSDICSKELSRDRAAEVLLHVSPDPEDEEGLGLLANFRLRELLGSGGTGVVFRAYDLALDREIALKVLRPSLGDLARDRFVAEARAAASIDHENVVTIYQVGEQERMAWIAMKWVPGETLESRLVREGSLAEQEVRQLSIQIARGLAEAHRQQLVHRDIKPANVWIGDADGKVLILDFGLVRITDNDPALTATGMLAGTPNFMSPEQAKGQELDARSDLFSLGCVMYQMITGTLPFGSPTILATLQAIQTQQPEPPILFADDCSKELSDLTMALLEKQPTNRVDSAESLVRCLESPRGDWPANIKRCIAANQKGNERGQKPTATPATQGSRFGRFGAGTLIGALLLGLMGFGLWCAPQIIRISTDQGELVIKTENKDVTVKVSGDGGDVRVLDASTGASFDIRSGEFTITAVGKDGKTEFEVVPNQLTMRRGGREVVTVTQKLKTTSPAPPSVADQVGDNANTKDAAELLYRGQRLSDWRKVLEVDRDPQTQVEALKACASLYMTSGQHDEFKNLLQNYVQRNGVYRRKSPESTICYSGFEDSLKKLPPQEIADFFKRQFKQGTVTSIDWTFRAIESSRAPVLTSDIHRELKSNPVELLRLIAAREDGNAWFAKLQKYELIDLVLDLIEGQSASDETVNLIKAIMVKLRPDEILKLATRVPKRALTPQLFAPVMDRLLAEGMTDGERLQLIEGVVGVEKSTDNHVSFLLEMLESKAIELLRLTAKRDSSNKTRELFVYIVENLLKNPLSDDAEDAVRAVMVKFEWKDFSLVTREIPKLALDEKSFASLNAQLFAADTKPKERDVLIKTLTSIEKRAKGKAAFILKTLAKVIANQMYATDKINFDKLKEMTVYAATQPGKDEKSYQVTQMFIYEGFANVEISGNAVVARNLLSGICKRLISRDVSSNKEIAKAVFEILSNPPSSEQVSDPTKLKHFKQLRIEDDIEQLGKLATNRPGQFSEFISGSPKFKGDPEILQTAETTKALSGSSTSFKPLKQTAKPLPQSKQSSIEEQNAGGTDDGQTPALYRGKPLTAWKKTLEVDRDPRTQAEALKACANLCLSSGQHDEFKALLQSYIQRNENLYQGEESTVCFLGFEDSLKKLPSQEIAAFFKRQLQQGTATSIDWAFRGMTLRRDPSSMPFSPKLEQELKADSVEILRLIDARDKSESVSYLLDFVLVYLVKDQPVSDEAVNLIKSIMARSTAYQIIKIASYVPKRALTPQLFAPLKARLLAADTTDAKRLRLIEALTEVADRRGDDASFFLKMLKSHAMEILRLTAKSKNQTYTSKKLLLYIIKNLLDDPLSTDAISRRQIRYGQTGVSRFLASDKWGK